MHNFRRYFSLASCYIRNLTKWIWGYKNKASNIVVFPELFAPNKIVNGASSISPLFMPLKFSNLNFFIIAMPRSSLFFLIKTMKQQINKRYLLGIVWLCYGLWFRCVLRFLLVLLHFWDLFFMLGVRFYLLFFTGFFRVYVFRSLKPPLKLYS